MMGSFLLAVWMVLLLAGAIFGAFYLGRTEAARLNEEEKREESDG